MPEGRYVRNHRHHSGPRGSNLQFIYPKAANDPASGFETPGAFSQGLQRWVQANGEYGYNAVFGQPERGLLDADFTINPGLSAHLVFNGVGAEQTVVIGTARLAEDFIARPWQADPVNPAELEIALVANINGTTVHFGAVPDVKTGLAAGGAATVPGRAGQANGDFEGTTASPNTDFRAHFTPFEPEFVVGGHRFTATIRDIVFTAPNQPPIPTSMAGAPVYTPLEVENVAMTIRYAGEV
jgi:hypothetical protein